MRIYITGGTGFIGSYVTARLAELKKHELIVLARNPEKVPALKKLHNTKVIKAPFDDYASLKKKLVKPDALIHIALCWGETGPDMLANETLSSIKLIDLAVKRGAKKIIFTSSTAASGYSQKNPSEKTMLNPSDFYGAGKGAAELFISAYRNYHPKIKFNIVRPGYTFGNPVIPGADTQPDTRFKDICIKAKTGRKITVTENDGTQFIWAGDLAEIYKNIIETNTRSEIFYGLSKNFTTWKQIAKWAVKYTAGKSKITAVDRGFSPHPVLFDVSKIDRFFGLSFNPSEKIKEHIKYFIENS